MSIQTGLFTTLKGLVNNKVYPMVAPQNTAPPYITYQRISTFDTQTIEGTQSLDLARFQISIYSKNYIESVNLAESVSNAMSGKALKLSHVEDYESDTLLFSQKIDYQLSDDIIH